jgi:hypothetical protein
VSGDRGDLRAAEEQRRRLADADAEEHHEHERHEIDVVRDELRRHDSELASDGNSNSEGKG